VSECLVSQGVAAVTIHTPPSEQKSLDQTVVLKDVNHLRLFAKSYTRICSVVLSCLQTKDILNILYYSEHVSGSPIKAFW